MNLRRNLIKNREIVWRDVFYKMLKGWRVLVILILIGAVIGGMSGYYLSIKNEEKLQKKHDKQVKELEETEGYISEDTLSKMIEEVNAMTNEEIEDKLYLNQLNSVKLAVSYINEVGSYYKTAKTEFVPNINVPYEYSVLIKNEQGKEKEVADYLMSLLGILHIEDYVSEETKQITTGKTYFIRGYLDRDGNVCESDNIISIVFWNSNPETYEELRDGCSKLMDVLMNSASEIYGNTSKKIIIANTTLNANNYMKEVYSKNVLDWYENLNAFVMMRPYFNFYMQALYNRLTNVWDFNLYEYVDPAITAAGDTLELPTPVKVVKRRFSPLEFLIGGIALPLVYLIILFFVCVFSNKLVVGDDTYEIFGLYNYGNVYKDTIRKKEWFLDKLFKKVRYKGRFFNEDKTVNMITSRIAISTEKEQNRKVALVSVNMTERTKAICEKLSESLKTENIETVIVNDIIYDPKSVKALEGIDNAVTIETSGVTKYTEVFDEIDLLNHEKVNNLGMIVVEG